MFNNVATIITKDYILQHVSEEQIFQRYLGLEPVERGTFVNPLRPGDHNPGCNFYINERGTWKFKDYAAKYNWDCFNVVEYVYGYTFKEALIRIAIDFNLINGSASVLTRSIQGRTKKVTQEIRIKRRSWTKEDYAIWAKFYITPERLEFFKVYPLQHAWFLEGNILLDAYYYKYQDPCFAYHFGDYEYKLYFPLRTQGKFLHVNSSILQGYTQLPKEADNFLFTKAFKDVMCIDVFSREFDLYSAAPMAETIVVSDELFSDIYNRFDNIGTLFDFDRTGITLTRKYVEKFKTTSYFFNTSFRGTLFGKPKIKDFADYLMYNGIDKTKRLIEQFITLKQHDGKVF